MTRAVMLTSLLITTLKFKFVQNERKQRKTRNSAKKTSNWKTNIGEKVATPPPPLPNKPTNIRKTGGQRKQGGQTI